MLRSTPLLVLVFLGLVAAPATAPGAQQQSALCALSLRVCSGKDLDGRSFTALNLTRTRWGNASLVGTSFRRTDLFGSSFYRADLRRADLSMGNRTQADFRRANLNGAYLAHADFWGSRFGRADLRGTTIDGARFDKADLSEVDFTGARIRKSTFYGARLCHTIQQNGTVRNDSCSHARAVGAGGGGWNTKTLPK
jgi:uncharacterized protein YjbI with pentapeptide repeats